MDFQIRTAAFNWLEKQVLLHGDLLPRKILEQGFYFHGQRVTLLGPPGIWKPKALELPISITTVANGPYDDVITTKGMLEYRYRGTDPHHRDNVGLRETMRNNIPLIYFLGIEPGKYLAEWPVFIVEDLPQTLIFRVLIDEKSLVESYDEVNPGEALYVFDEAADYRREYVTSPDYQIVVREDVLQELDGPMLKHGIQQMHNRKIILPGDKTNWPDRERLEIRFNKFKEVG